MSSSSARAPAPASKRPRLLWYMLIPMLMVSGLGILGSALYARVAMDEVYEERCRKDLEDRARLLQVEALAAVQSGKTEAMDAFCKVHAGASATRLTLILPDGTVTGDSEDEPRRMDNHGARPEIKAALQGQLGTASRPSPTIHVEMLYVALPLAVEGRVVAVLRVAMSLADIETASRTFYMQLALGGLVVFGLVSGVSWLLARKLIRPLLELRQAADRISTGDLSAPCAPPEVEEFAAMAESLNRMALQLDDRIRTLLRQRNELEAVLSSMVEGVLVMDKEERLIRINRAASDFLGLKAEETIGRSIQEVVRNADLHRFLARTRETSAPTEDQVVLRVGSDERFIQVHGTVLGDTGSHVLGVLVVMNDITRTRRLESVRRDFVANVSHELKTPITSIKGFVETLLDGALKDPKEAENFLQIVARQADRLNAIIEDLLTLSKIEQGEEQESIVLEEAALREVVKSAVQACELKASSKEIRIELSGDEQLRAPINAPLLEQAVINLIDNAIKYSEPGSRVQVETCRRGNEIAICIKDSGCGISQEHLPRIFERFYRVDKARSRKLGGTGLGLAIVKHIAQAHKGRIGVESTPGKGSSFTIYI